MKSKYFNNIDFDRVNLLLEGFNKSTGFVTAILDLEGNVLSKSGWRQICTEFHRKNPQSARNCMFSDTVLANNTKVGQRYHFYKCKNGLVDVAVQIVIKGEHVANLFSGQFFFESPDISFFKKQAEMYGFDETAYLEALGKVPVVAEEDVKVKMDFLLSITQVIAEMTFEKFEQLELNATIKQSEAALRTSQEQLNENMKDLLASQRVAHVGTWRLNLLTNEVEWSKELYKMYGLDPTFPPPRYNESMKLFTPDSWDKLSKAIANTQETGQPYELELETIATNGVKGWMWARGEASADSQGRNVFLWGVTQDITKQKKVEIQLRDSEERFHLLFDKAPLGYQSLDFEGNFIEVNQKWLDIFGYQRDEVIGKWFGDFLAPGYQQAFRERFPIFKSQGYIHSEFEMVGKHGETMFIAFDGKIGYADDGAFQQTHCILKDITVEKALSKELAESRELMQAIIENTTDAIYVKDLKGRYMLANHTVEQVAGKNKAELIGKDDYSLFPAEEAAAIMAADREICASGITRTLEETGTDATGKVNIFSSTKGPIRDLDNNIIGLFGIARNVTEWKELDTQLELERKLLQATLISVGDGVITSDIQGRVQFMNPVAEKLTGWTQKEAQGHQIEEIFNIFNELTGEKSASITRLVFETGSIVGLANHTALISKHGEKRPIEDCAAPIIMENGEIIGVVVVFSDFTEKRKRMEEIEYLSYHDYLTGLYNRRFFEEEMNRHDVSRNYPISIVMGDVNGLKLVNDSFGHPTGDEILKRAANLIVEVCREDDIVARLGGDEFVILLPQATAEDAAGLINRVQTQMAGETIEGIPLSVSFGQATKTEENISMSAMLKDAEDHMYRHKLYESTGVRSRTVTLIINTLYAKNHREMLHSQRVGALCATIASALGYPTDDVNQMKTAGLMHDIGKIGIEDKILNKSEPLNQQEWDEIKKHCEIGYRILSSATEFSEIADFVLEHQEKWDGTGYPRGLRGCEISKEARIIAVADSFDAMTGERSHGRVYTKEEAIKELQRCSGTQFDPDIVKVFSEVICPSNS